MQQTPVQETAQEQEVWQKHEAVGRMEAIVRLDAGQELAAVRFPNAGIGWMRFSWHGMSFA